MPKIYGSSEIWGDLLVTGSFSILGSASVINTTSLVVSDTIIALGHSQSGSPILDEGFMFVRGTGATQAFIWDESDDTFALISTTEDHTVIGDMNISGYSNLRVGGLTTSNLKIIGGTNGYILTSDSSGNANWTQLPGGLTGSGTSNYIPKWTNSNTLSSTSIYEDNNGLVGIGLITPSATLDIVSTTSSAVEINNTSAFLPSGSKYGINSTVGGSNFSLTNYGLYQSVSGANTANYGAFSYVSGTYGSSKSGFYAQVTDSNSTNTENSAFSGYIDGGWKNTGLSLNLGGISSVNDDAGVFVFLSSSLSSSQSISHGSYIRNNSTKNSKYGSTIGVDGNNLSSYNYGIYSQTSGGSILNYGILNQVSGTYGALYGIQSSVIGIGNTNEIIGSFNYANGSLSYNIAQRNQIIGTYGIGYRQVQQNILGNFVGLSGDATQYNVIGTDIYNISGSLANIANYIYGSASSIYGLYNNLQGKSNSLYGINNILSSTTSNVSYAQFNQIYGSGQKYGTYNNINGGTYSDSSYGLYNSIYGDGGKIGVYNVFSGTYSPTRYGIYTTSTGNNTSTYGEYIQLSGTGSTNYGIYVDSFSASTNYGIVVNRGDVVFNESGENYDFRVEGDTDQNLLFTDASTDRIGVGTTSPQYKLQVLGTVSTTGFRMTNGSSNGYILQSDASGNATWVIPGGGGLTGSGITNYLSKWTGTGTIGTSSIYDNGTNVYVGDNYSILDYATYEYALSVSKNNGNTFSIGMIVDSGSANTLSYGMLVNQNVYNKPSSSNTGIYIQQDVLSVSSVSGIDINITGTPSSSSSYGIKNSMNLSADYFKGIFNDINSPTNPTQIIGIMNQIVKSATYSYGIYNYVVRSKLSGNGIYTIVSGTESGTFNGYNISNPSISGNSSSDSYYFNADDIGIGYSKIAFKTNLGGNNKSVNNYAAYYEVTGASVSNYGVYSKIYGTYGTNYGMYIDSYSASTSYGVLVNRGTSIFNESGGDYDFRVEGDTDSNLLFIDASTDRVGIGTASLNYKLQVSGTVSTTGFRMTNGSSNGFVLSSNSDGVGSWTSSTRDLSFGHSSISPTGSTTYHIGMVPQLQPTTTDQVSRRIRSPYRGEITSVSIMWSLTTNGSSEAVTYQIHNITQATSATVTSSAQLTGDSHNTYTLGSPLAVSENDDLQIRWVTPVWATKPTSTIHVITARIRVY